MIEANQTYGRDYCLECNRKRELCLCSKISSFEFNPQIILLVHPKEYKKSVGTFRIVRLSIKNSICFRGYGSDFDENEMLLKVVNDPQVYPMVLFPGGDSLNLDTVTDEAIKNRIPKDKRLVILVIDGTWAHARKMIRTSRLLKSIPKISFHPAFLSAYQFRRQPNDFCLSTVEAVYALIETLKKRGLCSLPPDNLHKKMVANFHELVEVQLKRQLGVL